jgi:hypothetical protein
MHMNVFSTHIHHLKYAPDHKYIMFIEICTMIQTLYILRLINRLCSTLGELQKTEPNITSLFVILI